MTRRTSRLCLLLLLIVAVGASVIQLTGPSDTTPELKLAADISQFDPGNIISDAMFFDPNALTAGQVADFIAAKGASCRVGTDGSPCLKNFRQDTFSRPADGICDNAYFGGSGESAATIITKVASACNVSAKVLLVLLQKEQALITTTNPTARKYQIAAGMGCPDTAACDSQYYGFYNQIYSAARQYQRYATNPTKYSYRAGVNNSILWSPTTSCGTSTVYIRNQATAGLYNYTPYRPNAAALAAGYGTGDSCSAYGNRNFWLYFTDWFGSTQSPGGDAVLAAYAAQGGASGPLGAWTTWVICGLTNAGCGQVFQNGTIYWSSATGAHSVAEPVLSGWGSIRERGPLGYPTTDTICGLKDGGCGQVFQGGRIYSTAATGTQAVSEPVLGSWIGVGVETGVMGYPISPLWCGLKDNSCGQVFQGGRIYTSATTGTHAITGQIHTEWVQEGLDKGPLGLPTSEVTCGLKDGGCGQAFQGGRMFSTSATGTHAVLGAVDTAWEQQQLERGPLGYPTADQVCGLTGGGCLQDFQGGRVYSHPTAGAHSVSGTVATVLASTGGEAGPLGYPTSDLICGLKDGGCGQVFQGGRVYDTAATGAHAVTGSTRDTWIEQGAERGPLGYATGDQVCGLAGGGCKQAFQGGTIYSSPSAGTYAVSGALPAAWASAGSEGGALGYPTTGLICGLKDGGCGQVFQGGRIYNTTATGAHALTGPILTAWLAQGWENGSLGYATGDQVCGLAGGGCKQAFQGGTIYSSPSGTYTVSGAIRTAWASAGSEAGALGYPTTGLICGLRNGGCGQVFLGGRIYNTTATGAHPLTGPILTAWLAQGWENGSLGYATSDSRPVTGGTTQDFQGGRLTLDSSTGQVTRN
jgi:uncharacterized protein with LGFP repeats